MTRSSQQKFSICIMNSVHPASDTRVLKISRTLADAGHDVTVIAPSIPTLADRTTAIPELLQFIEISKPVGSFRPGSDLGALLGTLLSRIAVSLQLLKQGWRLRADVYHCNEVDSWFIGILLKLLLRKRLVFDVHEYYPSLLVGLIPCSWLNKPIECFLTMLFTLASRMTDGAIFVNQSLADLYGFRCPQVVLRHCVEQRYVQARSEDTNLVLEEQEAERFVLLHIGKMRAIYGADALAETLALLQDIPDLVCVILGGISAVLSDTILEKYAELASAGRLEVKERVSFEEVIDFAKTADVGLTILQPSQKNLIYSLGRKFLEYVSCGLPVVASDFPEMRLIVQKYELGLLVNPEDPQHVAQAIRALVCNSNLRRRMSQNSQTAFEQELNWEMEREKLYGLYSLMAS